MDHPITVEFPNRGNCAKAKALADPRTDDLTIEAVMNDFLQRYDAR